MTNQMDRVFISYRRQTSKYAALLVYKDLTQHGYDVFIDYESIDSGKFAEVIRHQIAARSHFVAVLAPGCLDRTVYPDDWLRHEVEYAIDTQRNIVPLLFDGFSFEKEKRFLTGKLAALKEYNGPTVPDGYFDEAMNKLRNRFLKQPAKGAVRPAPAADQLFVQKALQKADQAAEQESFQDALLKYLAKPAKGFLQALSGERPATFDMLGRPPMADEVVQLDELLQGPLLWKTPELTRLTQFGGPRDKRLLLTNKRLILRDLGNERESFQIPRFILSFAKVTYRKLQLGLFYQMSIKVWDGTEYTIELGAENMERVQEFIPERE